MNPATTPPPTTQPLPRDATNQPPDTTPPPATVPARDNSVTIGLLAGLVALILGLITGSCITVTIIAAFWKQCNKKTPTLQTGVALQLNPPTTESLGATPVSGAIRRYKVEPLTQNPDLRPEYSKLTTTVGQDRSVSILYPLLTQRKYHTETKGLHTCYKSETTMLLSIHRIKGLSALHHCSSFIV